MDDFAHLADPTTVIVTDGTPEADASVMCARIEAAACMGCDKTQEGCSTSCPARLAGGWER